MHHLDHIRILCLIIENIFSKGYWQTVLWLSEACQDSDIEITGYVQLYVQLCSIILSKYFFMEGWGGWSSDSWNLPVEEIGWKVLWNWL